jgi:hypothetical protein
MGHEHREHYRTTQVENTYEKMLKKAGKKVVSTLGFHKPVKLKEEYRAKFREFTSKKDKLKY